jgi:hypothetical protein
VHEQSQTIRLPNGRYVNVNGVTRQPLTPRFPFEQATYPAVPGKYPWSLADNAAALRSIWEGRLNEEMGPVQQLESSALARLAAGRRKP